MTEDDTFNALKKWPFEKLNDKWNLPFENLKPDGWYSILEEAGWTNDEFWRKRGEYYGRRRDIFKIETSTS